MGSGFECSSAVLLCAEDNSSIWGFDDEESGRGELVGCQTVVGCPERRDLSGESLVGSPLWTDECVELLVSKEGEFLPKSGYVERLRHDPLILSIRIEAVDWIGKVHAYYNFGPSTACLSVNYLDRFLSSYEFPQGKEWMTQLLSVACLSLAAKMEETIAPLPLDLQVCEPRYIFEAKTIQRMELLVLSTLQWRMQAVTPFSFIDYFLCKFSNAKSMPMLSLPELLEVIKSTARRIDFLEFTPSEVALAVTLFMAHINTVADYDKLLSFCLFVDKERAMRCYELIKAMTFMNRTFKCSSASAFSAQRGHIEVLDVLSSSSEVTSIGSPPAPSSRHFSPDAKRRRFYGLPIYDKRDPSFFG